MAGIEVTYYSIADTEVIAQFINKLRHVTKVRLLPYHNYAGSKYKALGMDNTLPSRLPSEEELARARQILKSAGLWVV